MRQAEPIPVRRSLPLLGCAAVISAALWSAVPTRADDVAAEAGISKQDVSKSDVSKSDVSEPGQPQAAIDDVRIGFDGRYKKGFWTPVWVTVTAGTEALTARIGITSLDGSGLDVQSVGPQDVSIPAGQTVTLLQYAKMGRLHKGLSVTLHGGDQPLARTPVSFRDRPKPLDSDALFIVSLGGDIGVAEGISRDPTAADVTPVQIKRADQLPSDWFGYEGVDVVVLTTHANPLLDDLSLQQTSALRQWVEMGGQLVMCLGESGGRIMEASDRSPMHQLAALVPGDFVRVATLGNAAALENYTGGAESLRLSGDRHVRMTILDHVRGNLELSDDGVNERRPMVIRAPFGFGRVVFVAFDLDQPPLADWDGRSRMVVKVLRGAAAQENRAVDRQQSGQVSHVGYDDMVGQLRGALDQFDGVSFVAFSVVATLILIYIVLIGPVDYFLLKNVIGRMQLTWVTFPVIVAGFLALAFVLKAQLKNDAVLVNQVDLIDVDASTGLVRGTTWAHLYSPVTETYDVTLTPAVTDSADATTSNLLSWQGMPGTGLGGLNSTSAPIAFAKPYTVSTDVTVPLIAGLPIPTGATTAISSRWWQHIQWEHPTSLRSDSDDLLQGEVVNPLDVELHDCMIFYSVWAYHLERSRGRLAPGQAARAEDERPRNLQWRMTRRAVKDMKDVSTPWDPASFDVPRIMEMMMFRDVAGGDQYTKLSHRYQGYVDLSAHLQRGRAVLIGRIDQRGTEVSVNGQTLDRDAGQHWTFCRVVFPVTRAKDRNE